MFIPVAILTVFVLGSLIFLLVVGSIPREIDRPCPYCGVVDPRKSVCPGCGYEKEF